MQIDKDFVVSINFTLKDDAGDVIDVADEGEDDEINLVPNQEYNPYPPTPTPLLIGYEWMPADHLMNSGGAWMDSGGAWMSGTEWWL